MRIIILLLITVLAECALWVYPALPVRPAATLTPTHDDYTAVYPLSRIQDVTLGETTSIQLQAAFGQPINRSGRPPRLRFESRNCILLVALSRDTANEMELLDYGTLDLLLAGYGDPAAVGMAEGNLTVPVAGSTVLLYPAQGVIAVFEVAPDELTPATPIDSLTFRTPYDLERQLTRLDLTLVEWQLSPSSQD